MQTCTKRNPKEIADEIIGRIEGRKNPFDKITVVFHSAKIAGWFKAYYLKMKRDDDAVLMNVEFENLSSFINKIINVHGEPDRILTIGEYREYIARALTETSDDFPEKSYYSDGGAINGINLYELSDKLSAVIINAEFNSQLDGDIFGNSENIWQKKIYDLANKYAADDNCYTPLRMCSKNAEHFATPDGDVYIFDNSYITTLYLDILGSIGDRLTVFSLNGADDDNARTGTPQNIRLVAAPSKMREVERLHSDICAKLFADGSIDRVGDFVVYAPNINDYAGYIHRVFKRSGKGFPEIPVRIIGECKEKQDMISALNLLYEIANKGFFTRYDLGRYLRNGMVMYTQSIDSNDIDAFMHAIDETNTRRGDGENIDDWDYLKKRLLTSMLSDGETPLTGGKTLPYSDMSTDDARINKLIEIIDRLSDFAGCFNGDLAANMLSGKDIETLTEKLNNLFSSESHGEEKNYLYAEVRREAEKLGKIFADSKLPATAFLLFLKDAPSRYSSSPADVFSGGVTFLGLDIDNIVAEKYIYVLGLSSDVFPRIESENEIDFSANHKTVYDLDRAAFKNLMNCGDNITLSYVNCDLKDGGDHFPSAVIPENVNRGNPVPLDESRNLEELFTRRELFAKMRFDNIGSENKKTEKPTLECAEDVPKITSGMMKSYLENSFVYKYRQILRESDDEEENLKSGEYEPIDTEPLDRHFLVRDIILSAVKAAKSGEKWDKDSLYERMTLEKRLPRNFEKEYFDDIYINAAKPVIDDISGGYSEIKPFSLEISDKKNEKRIFEINGRCFVKEEDTNLYFIEPRERRGNPKNYLLPYVCALAYVAAKGGNAGYSVTLISKAATDPFTVTPPKAKETLGEIIERMLDFEKIRYTDIVFVDGNADKLPETITDLTEEIINHSGWSYFADKKAITPNVDFGYSPDGAKAEIIEEYRKMRKLILYYEPYEPKEESGDVQCGDRI